MTGYYGGNGSETLDSSNWDYSWRAFTMYGGDDRVVTPSTGVSYRFEGREGDDYFLGDTAADTAFGGADNDRLYGYSGNDTLYGQDGSDKLYGGAGIDILYGGASADRLDGGAGKDYLYGGQHQDTFVVTQGNSNATNNEADFIADWDVREDWIDSPLAGRSNGYSEAMTAATSMDSARYQVEHTASLSDGDHTFLYNPSTDTGYLLSDLDGNYTFETGVIIKGAGSASDMSWSDII